MISQRARKSILPMFAGALALLSSGAWAAPTDTASQIANKSGAVPTSSTAATSHTDDKSDASKATDLKSVPTAPGTKVRMPAGVPLATSDAQPVPQLVITVESFDQQALVNKGYAALNSKQYPEIEAELARLTKTRRFGTTPRYKPCN